MIEVQNLQKAYGANIAVAGVSFDIRKGETLGLLGPNGAGKTTTISMMVGVLRPDGGTVRVNGANDPTRAEVRRQLGVAPQSLSLYEELTAEENLAFFGRLYGLAGGALQERVNWGLEFAGLTDRRRDRITTYSGGMKRRINLACAMIHDPAVVFMDEPTVGVDPQSRNHIFESIERLKRDGRTILYTTHYMEEAQRLCNRVAIMDHGKLLALDTVDGLIQQHGGRSVVTAELAKPPDDPALLSTAHASSSAPHTQLNGLSLRLETEHPLEEVARIAAKGVAFRTLRVDRPDLETVFLKLTGRSLRDE